MSEIQSSISLTVSAADEIATLIAEENNPKLNLRIYISGGGCAGFQYGFTFDEVINDDDVVVEQRCSDGKSSAKLLIDSMSFPYLKDATIHFTSGLQKQFSIENPNAQTTCGCGSSFSLPEDPPEED